MINCELFLLFFFFIFFGIFFYTFSKRQCALGTLTLKRKVKKRVFYVSVSVVKENKVLRVLNNDKQENLCIWKPCQPNHIQRQCYTDFVGFECVYFFLLSCEKNYKVI